MTPEQYDRWKDFALRLGAVWVSARRTKPSRAWVREQIEFFFEVYMDAEQATAIGSWDDTDMSCSVADLIETIVMNERPPFLKFDEEHERYEHRREAWLRRWVNPITGSIRAGLDVACKPSGGVVGFTVGHLRKMYPEGIPDWVATPDPPFRGDDGEPIDLRTRPDDESVWL